ncbi:Hypothetical_protein [Hexamita inflata]|uniref:Hypothetical_protein n=1 Tax=Hexamita inflata TaxID=28002 RepID=A0AA86QNS7_9EUKA|nr:Hypothetical protein HINF_LOCUS42820 [Hexamita inflata]
MDFRMIAKHEKTYWTNIIGLKIQQLLKDLTSISVTQRLQDGIAKRHIIVMINITHLYQYISGIYISVCTISKLIYVNYQIIPVILRAKVDQLIWKITGMPLLRFWNRCHSTNVNITARALVEANIL